MAYRRFQRLFKATCLDFFREFYEESCLSQIKCWVVLQGCLLILKDIDFDKARHPLFWSAETPIWPPVFGSVALNCSKSIVCPVVIHFQSPNSSAAVPAVQNPSAGYAPEFEETDWNHDCNICMFCHPHRLYGEGVVGRTCALTPGSTVKRI